MGRPWERVHPAWGWVLVAVGLAGAALANRRIDGDPYAFGWLTFGLLCAVVVSGGIALAMSRSEIKGPISASAERRRQLGLDDDDST